MVSAAQCGIFLSKLLAVALVALGMVFATVGLGIIQQSCRDHNNSSTCSSGLQPHWWSLMFQGIILVSMVVLKLCSKLKQWRFVVLTFLAMATARLMWDAGDALEVNSNRAKMHHEADELHEKVVLEFNKSGGSGWERSVWEDNPERERVFWESVALGYKFLARDTMTRMKVEGDLDSWAVLMYVAGLSLVAVVNVAMLVVYGGEKGERAVVAQEKVEEDKVGLREKGAQDSAYSPPEEPFMSPVAPEGYHDSSGS